MIEVRGKSNSTNRYSENGLVSVTLHRLRRIEHFCLWGLGFAGLLILLFSIYWGQSCPDVCKSKGSGFVMAMTLSLAAFMAASLTGGLLGFLFGLPRSPSDRPQPVPAAGNASAKDSPLLRTNTSIEDISSTLSTMLVGASLTQFNLVMDTLYRLSLFLAYQLTGDTGIKKQDLSHIEAYTAPLPSPYFFCLIIIAFILGIFFGYIETRTRITIFLVGSEHLSYMDGGSLAEADESLLDDNKPTPAEFRLLEEPDPTLPLTGTHAPLKPIRPTDVDIQRAQEPEPQSLDEKVKWAVAKAKIGDYQAATTALTSVKNLLPTSNTVISLISDVQSLSTSISSAVQVLMDGIADKTPIDRKPLYRKLKQTLLNALYEKEGFEAAIKASDALITNGESSALDYVRRACAFGQKYKHLLGQKAPQADLDAAAQSAREAMDKVVELKPVSHFTRVLLAELLNASPDNQDNDLVVVRDHPEIQSNLTKYTDLSTHPVPEA